MIRNGQIKQMAQIARFVEGKADKEGRFEFPHVPPDAEVELAWWGEKIASGRSHFNCSFLTFRIVPVDGVQ